MNREILPVEKINPAALAFIQNNHSATISEIKNAIAQNKIVVIGMAQNPVVKKQKKFWPNKNWNSLILSMEATSQNGSKDWRLKCGVAGRLTLKFL